MFKTSFPQANEFQYWLMSKLQDEHISELVIKTQTPLSYKDGYNSQLRNMKVNADTCNMILCIIALKQEIRASICSGFDENNSFSFLSL